MSKYSDVQSDGFYQDCDKIAEEILSSESKAVDAGLMIAGQIYELAEDHFSKFENGLKDAADMAFEFIVVDNRKNNSKWFSDEDEAKKIAGEIGASFSENR